MRIKLFLFSFLLSLNAIACNDLLVSTGIQEIRQFVENADRGDYNITMDNNSGLVVVVSNYQAMKLSQFLQFINELEIDYEVLEFFGTTAFHFKY